MKEEKHNHPSRLIDPNRSKILLFVNAILFFVVAFLIGNSIAAAQIKYFDEPEPEPAAVQSPKTIAAANQSAAAREAQLAELRSRPTTEQYQEFKDQMSVTISPENPGPNQEVKINVEVYSFDINSAEITWKQNGAVKASGLGRKSFAFKTGNAGVETKIEVSIDPRDRPILKQLFSFIPGEVDLLWQAEVYSHPFYKGKSLYTPESNITFVAMPRNGGGAIRPNETVFNWKINGTRFADKSGYGKNTYTFEGPILLRPVKAEVETYTPTKGAGDSKEVASDNVTVLPTDAFLRLYEDNLSYGMLFNRALIGDMILYKPEVTIAAYPYFQTILGKNSGPQYSWMVDSIPVDIAASQNSVTLRKKEGDQGQSYIDVKATNPLKILQTTGAGLSISFDKKTQALKSKSENEFGN